MAQHTPGPWRVLQGGEDRDFIIADASGNTIAEPNAELYNEWPPLAPHIHHISVAEAKANARLIAASPDMLKQLKALADGDPDRAAAQALLAHIEGVQP